MFCLVRVNFVAYWSEGSESLYTLYKKSLNPYYPIADNAHSPEKSTIGGSVRISDIYALIDNCSMVDYQMCIRDRNEERLNTMAGKLDQMNSAFENLVVTVGM